MGRRQVRSVIGYHDPKKGMFVPYEREEWKKFIPKARPEITKNQLMKTKIGFL